jgi:Fe-S cluster assembly ATPase SufC
LNTETAGKLEKAMPDFEIKDLRVSVEGRQILKGVSLTVNKGEVP